MKLLVLFATLLIAWLLLRPMFKPRSKPPAANAAKGSITEAEAYAILGLDQTASDDEVRDAYTQLMKKLHPDQGGSDYFAERLNSARDLLLKDR